MGKKQEVIEELYLICQQRNDFKFNNELVKEVCKKIGFGNPFDVTKIDNKKVLPRNLLENDIAVIHLGSGWHQFIKGVSSLYHNFEAIQEEIIWDYRKSILNEYNTSESNILSVANNQRVLHNFTFGKDKDLTTKR